MLISLNSVDALVASVNEHQTSLILQLLSPTTLIFLGVLLATPNLLTVNTGDDSAIPLIFVTQSTSQHF